MRALPVARIGFVLLAAFGLLLIVSLALTAQADEGEQRERVLLMNSGRILSGQMTRNAGGWLVEQSNGRVQVPEDQVKLVADNLRDAYRKQRDAIVEPTPGTHIMLAQWCISYRLHDEARDELRKCLKRDPDHEEARKLLRRLDESLAKKPTAVPAAISTWKTADGFTIPEVESLGGLSKETATAFTARIQPLLMNKCGNAACHGSASTSGFKLNSNRFGANGHRLYTERNLAEILRYVELKDPSLSPLIAVPQGSHGGTTAIFHGPQSAEQLKSLRSFIKRVVAEKQLEERELALRPSVLGRQKPALGETGPTTTTPVPDGVGSSASVARRGPGDRGSSPGVPHRDRAVMQASASETQLGSRITPASATEDGTPRALPDDDSAEPMDEPSLDPFDPDHFNRRFHGTKPTRQK